MIVCVRAAGHPRSFSVKTFALTNALSNIAACIVLRGKVGAKSNESKEKREQAPSGASGGKYTHVENSSCLPHALGHVS